VIDLDAVIATARGSACRESEAALRRVTADHIVSWEQSPAFGLRLLDGLEPVAWIEQRGYSAAAVWQPITTSARSIELRRTLDRAARQTLHFIPCASSELVLAALADGAADGLDAVTMITDYYVLSDDPSS